MSQDDFRKAKCQHCGGRIGYPVAAEGTSIPCPHCSKDALLVPAPETVAIPSTPTPAAEPSPAPGEIRIRVMDQPAPKPVSHKPASTAPSAPPSRPAEEAPKRVVAKFKSAAEKSHESPKPEAATGGDMVACRQCGTVGQVDLMRREGETYICLSCQPARRGGVSVPQELSLDVAHAGFWRRVAAKCIDLLILTGPVIGIGFALKPAMPKLVPLMQQIPLIPKQEIALLILATMVAAVPLVLLYDVLFVAKLGATPGKLALGLRVIDGLGSRLRWGQAIKRSITELVLACTLNILFFQVNYIMVAFDPQKRSIHDWFAKSWVTRRNKPALADTAVEHAEAEQEA